jgi:hypothetical protein
MFEDLIIVFAIGLVALSSAVSFGIGRWLANRSQTKGGTGKLMLAALTPTIMIIAGIIVWQLIDEAMLPPERRVEYMGPLLLLIYGFPWFIVNLVVNVLAAIRGLYHR